MTVPAKESAIAIVTIAESKKTVFVFIVGWKFNPKKGESMTSQLTNRYVLYLQGQEEIALFNKFREKVQKEEGFGAMKRVIMAWVKEQVEGKL